MELLKREQIAGMNIHYLFYPLEYFLDAQVRAGIQTIEFWLGTPHFFLSHIEYTECVRVRKMIENSYKTSCGCIHYFVNIIDKQKITLVILPGLH